MKTRGVSVGIFRDARLGDCTKGGVTGLSRAAGKTFVVFDDEMSDGNWDLHECLMAHDIVPLQIIRRRFGKEIYMHLEVMPDWVHAPAGGPAMFGGNFAFTSDSRFRRVAQYPLPVHDRYET